MNHLFSYHRGHKPSRILALTDMNDGPMRYGRDMTACTSVIWFIHHHIMTGMKKSLKEMKTEQIHITEGVISQRAHITESVISRPYQIGPSSYQSRLHPTGLGGHSCLYFSYLRLQMLALMFERRLWRVFLHLADSDGEMSAFDFKVSQWSKAV